MKNHEREIFRKLGRRASGSKNKDVSKTVHWHKAAEADGPLKSEKQKSRKKSFLRGNRNGNPIKDPFLTDYPVQLIDL